MWRGFLELSDFSPVCDDLKELSHELHILINLFFSGLLQFKCYFVRGRDNTKYRE